MKKYFVLFSFLLSYGFKVAAAPYLASIPPLYSLAKGLLKDVAEIDLLLDGQASAHTYSLKPSDVEKIQQAGIVLWLGPAYESFLIKPIKSFDKQDIKLLEIEGLIRHPLRSGEEWHCEHSHDCCGHEHDLSHFDPHIWLDPANAQTMLAALKELFTDRHPEKKQIIEINYQRTTEAIFKLQKTLEEKLKPVKDNAFLVFHDGYQYFEKAYHLQGAGVMVINPESTPSVKHMRQLMEKANARKVKCIFSESQFNPALIEQFAHQNYLNLGTLDPVGTIKYHCEQDYIEMMTQLADNLVNCMKKP